MNYATKKLEELLQATRGELLAGHPSRGMHGLFEGLNQLRTEFGPSWDACRAHARSHELRELIHQDPMSRRSFEKPRGYAGDAVLLDYIYRLRGPSEATPIGRVVYDYAVARPAACAVRHRKEWIARAIDRAADETGGEARILSVACGHLREMNGSSALQNGWFDELVALDADPESLAVIEDGAHDAVRTLEMSIGRLMARGQRLGKFDLVYSAGLYDYLEPAVAERLTRSLFDLVEPGGRLLVSNFLPEVADGGYMETFMGWELIYRSESELATVTKDIDDDEVASCKVYRDPFDAIVYAEVQRRG